ncbi:MAG: AAA family ATPase, partial [Flammeovirgaceae bacterium]
DEEDLLSLQGDPKTFLKQFQGSVVIDEVQRAPNAFVTIKGITDTKKDFGQFLLTGSMNVLMLPKLSESLAGRIVVHTMWPLSQGEIRGVKETFVDSLFTKDSFVFSGELSDQEWASILVTGGYPHSL